MRHRRSRIRLRAKLVTVGAVGLASLVAAGAAAASTGSSSPISLPPGSSAPAAVAALASTPKAATTLALPAGTKGCAVSQSLNVMHCDLLMPPAKAHASGVSHQLNKVGPADTSITNSLGPADLQAAYNLTTVSPTGGEVVENGTSTGVGVTVAIVDAYGDPTIGTDLATYQSNWNSAYQAASKPTLPVCANPSAAGTATGTGNGCLTVLNQNGATSPLPPVGTVDANTIGWEEEEALDVEMVWAICPNCHIDLFQANSAGTSDLGTAENSAASVSSFISNSWSGLDYPGESAAFDNLYFNHPGKVLAFASGDLTPGQPQYPASSGLVTAVGGTVLTANAAGTGYSETVWDGQAIGSRPGTGPGTGTGAGCTTGEGKPSWQTDTGCASRTENDVSAVAAAEYGIDEYSSSGDGNCDDNGAFDEANDCGADGTSVATPIITAVYALANAATMGPVANTYPASYLYQPGHAADLNDITTGQAGSCESSRLYVCTAEKGYDGPTGWGTPNGIAAFTSTATGDIISIDNPGTYDLQAGIHYSLPAIKAYDSAVARPLTYSASGLPSGLSINSGTGVISGTISATPANAKAKVTVTDNNGGSATISLGIVSVKSLLSSYHAGTGLVESAPDSSNGNNTVRCLNDTRNSTANGTPVDIYGCENVASETGWSYTPSGAPGLPNTVNIHGRCMYASGNPIRSGAKVGLYQCNSAASEKWYLEGADGEIIQASSGLCLNDPNFSLANNTQLTVAPCNFESNQGFLMPASPVTSGIAGKCLAVSGGHAVSANCAVTSSQEVTLGFDGTLQIGGKCLYKTGSSFNNGTAVGTFACNGSSSEDWAVTAYGQIENLDSEKCLAVPNNNSGNGAFLGIEDCSGQPGEVWAVS